MCGIFGFVSASGSSWDNAQAVRAIRHLITLSERRGKEAAGVAVVRPSEISVFKRPLNPRTLLRSPDFESFLASVLPSSSTQARATSHEDGVGSNVAPIAVIGHCRLVTNGTQALHQNNQPVVFDGSVGVHNGIVTNAEALANGGLASTTLASKENTDKTRQNEAQSLSAKSSGLSGRLDSEILFQRLGRNLVDDGDLSRAITRLYSEIEGEASIAFFSRPFDGLVLATNSGSLYFAHSNSFFVFASEAYILDKFLADGLDKNASEGLRSTHLKPGEAILVDGLSAAVTPLAMGEPSPRIPMRSSKSRPVVDRSDGTRPLRRCTKCILPETYPFIRFDEHGVCNYCHTHVTQKVAGREALLRELDRYRSKDGREDCIVAFSGGRDSSYGLHLIKTELGMNPVAFTYDWGLVTDIARRNQARLCGKLGIEHIIRAADIPKQRRYVRQNIDAWLKRPELGMIPLFMAGDKFFYRYARELKKETGIKLVIFCAGNELERTQFKAGFAGVEENNYSNRLFGLAAHKKVQLASYYARQFLLNPSYINTSLLNSLSSFHSTFIGVDDFLYLYNYEPWDEKKINDTLIGQYNWETSPYSSNTWRIGDGYTAFINYIYLTAAGFTEYDAFRSNQIRDGLLGRDEALALARADNVPRLEDLESFAQLIGFNLETVLSRINEMPRLGAAHACA